MPLNDANAACTSNTVNLGAPPAGCRGVRGVPSQFSAVPAEIFIFTNVQPIAGEYSVSEVFAETLLPLLSGVTAVEQLDLSLAARYADYEARAASGRGRPVLTGRSTTQCDCARRSHAMSGRRLCRSGSIGRASAARSTTRCSAA